MVQCGRDERGDAYATATDSIAMLSSAAVTGNLEDYITGATIADKAGNIYGSSSRPSTTPLPVDPNDPTKAGVDIQMSMDIVFPENVVNSIVESGEDATFTYTMPDTIKFNSDILNENITDGSGNRIGSYSVVNGVLTATIDHTALEGEPSSRLSSRRGSIWISQSTMRKTRSRTNSQAL